VNANVVQTVRDNTQAAQNNSAAQTKRGSIEQSCEHTPTEKVGTRCEFDDSSNRATKMINLITGA
jgi:hypothetical protein